MSKKKALAGLSGWGETDMFGLNAEGEAKKMDTMQVWTGILAGGAVGTGASIAARSSGNPTAMMYSEGIGFAASAVVAGALYAMGKHNAAGAALAVGVVNNLIRQVEMWTMASPAAATMKGFGMPVIEPTRYVGERSRLSGLGIATIEKGHMVGARPSLNGLNGLSGLGAGGKPSLVGIDQAHGLVAAAKKVTMLGGPAIDGLASHYGATLFGGGR